MIKARRYYNRLFNQLPKLIPLEEMERESWRDYTAKVAALFFFFVAFLSPYIFSTTNSADKAWIIVLLPLLMLFPGIVVAPLIILRRHGRSLGKIEPATEDGVVEIMRTNAMIYAVNWISIVIVISAILFVTGYFVSFPPENYTWLSVLWTVSLSLMLFDLLERILSRDPFVLINIMVFTALIWLVDRAIFILAPAISYVQSVLDTLAQ